MKKNTFCIYLSIDISGLKITVSTKLISVKMEGSLQKNLLCSLLSLVLRRSEQDGVGLEDVDALQLELEALLSATVVRKMTLKEEIKILNNIEKYKGQGRPLKKVRSIFNEFRQKENAINK